MAPSFLGPESQRQLLEADPRWRVKCILRSLAAVFSLIGFSLFAAAIPTWDENFSGIIMDGTTTPGDWPDGMEIGVLVPTCIFNAILVFLSLKRKQSIHPLAPLLMDLLICAALLPAIVVSALTGIYNLWAEFSEPGVDIDFWPLLHFLGGHELGGLVFACVILILQITLVVFDCISMHNWRKSRKATTGRSPRALDHADFVRSQEEQDAEELPKYSRNLDDNELEMKPMGTGQSHG